ncbi:hypothetical protein Q3G72_017587 [Acer saccharum]|nr:hypothetical protein Q3G72_017587 [Acer saccharum]
MRHFRISAAQDIFVALLLVFVEKVPKCCRNCVRIIDATQFSECPYGKNKEDVRVDEVGDSSQGSKPKRGADKGRPPIPPCVENLNFPDQFTKWGKRKIIPEKGINVPELSQTPIPQMIASRSWETYVQHSPRYCPHIVREFYAGIIPRNYLLGGAVWVRGREVRINASDINRYFRTSIPEGVGDNMYKGITKNNIFTKMNVDLANSLTDYPLPY